MRTATRRQLREQEAAAMNQNSSNENEALWEDVAPHLDAALGELNDAERDALLLRYFEKKSAPEIAARIGISAAAAQKRVTRAVERLRESFSRRGIAVGTGGLIVALGGHAVQATPIGFAATISTAALAGKAVSASTVITTTKAIAMTTLQKTMITATLAVFAGAGIYEARQATQLREQNQKLEQQQAPMAEQNQHLQNADDPANGLASLREENAQLKSNQTELLKLRGEVDTLRSQAIDADKRAKIAEQKLAAGMSSGSLFRAHEAGTINAAKQLGLALHVFSENHANQFPTNLAQLSEQLGGSFSINGIEIFAFELINPGTEGLVHPNAVVLRERLSRQVLDGSWQRIYTFADGSVQTALSYDGNFDAWEKQNTYQPPPIQNQ